MLKEVYNNQTTDMSLDSSTMQSNKEPLALHHTNVYQPLKFSVKTITASPNKVFLVALRVCESQDSANKSISKLDIYDIASKGYPKFIFSIVEQENITGLAWLDEKSFLSVSLQATINVYSVKLGFKTKVLTTDYGPITCMRYTDSLLVTGTDIGYVIGYKVESNKLIAFDKKMTRILGSLKTLDFHIQHRDLPKNLSETKQVTRSNKKRKTAESSDSESEDDQASNIEEDFMAAYDVTIFGVCYSKVYVLDYHKTTILDSFTLEHEICCISALNNGDFILGTTEGYFGVYENKSFICRQNVRVSKSAISCLALNTKGSFVLAATQEPAITLFSTKKVDQSVSEFLWFEQIKDHGAQVNCALFTSKKEFFTCSDDDLIIKFRISKSDGVRKLKRFVTKSHHQSRIQFGTNELMTITGLTLNIYNIDANTQPHSNIRTYPLRVDLPAPTRTSVIKAYGYILAATFNDKYICYSTNTGIKIINRPDMNRLSGPKQDLAQCHILKLCQSGRFLVAGQQKKLVIFRLKDDESVEKSGESRISNKKRNKISEKVLSLEYMTTFHETVFVKKLKGIVRDVLYHQADEKLIVSCGIARHFLYILQLPQLASGDSEVKDSHFNLIHQLSLPSSPLSCLTLNYRDVQDPNLYIYTPRNQLIVCDIKSSSMKSHLTSSIEDHPSVSNISKDRPIQGIVVISRNICLLYDSSYILKLDINKNEIINETSKYEVLNAVSNVTFKQPEEILIV